MKKKESSSLFDEIKYKENTVKMEFSFGEFDFWINKGSGVGRKRMAATGFINANSDVQKKIDILSGKYDSVIESIMSSVVVVFEGNPQPIVKGDVFQDGFWSFCDMIGDSPYQMAIAENLVLIACSVIIGKKTIDSMTVQGISSKKSTEKQERASTTKK